MLKPLANSETNPDGFHQQLAQFNVRRIAPALPSAHWLTDMGTEFNWRMAEGHYLESLRELVTPLLPDQDGDTDNFINWFESLAAVGPGQQHTLFDWLAHNATLQQMRWFLTQEAAGQAGFDDLLAYTQVKLPVQAKLECARNYWDEMGHGKQSAMHGQMLERIVQQLDLQPAIETTVWQALALSNTMIGLATTRRYTWQSIGALGVIELTAPNRVKQVSIGLKRLGLSRDMRAYFDLHAALDVSHSKEWVREIIRPLVDADPACATHIAEGALIRLVCGERCFDRYSAELQCEVVTC